MKTIKYYRPFGGHVVRVSDEEAAMVVGRNEAMYAPKSWLKAARELEKHQ